MSWTAEIFGVAVVVVGDFNPAVFSPHWLERNQLLGADDTKAAQDDEGLVVTRKGTRFKTDWFSMQVIAERLMVTSEGVPTPSLRDLCSGMLLVLSHTPVRAVGLNYMAHYRLQNADDWHHIGDRLSPKAIWYGIFPPEKHSAGMTDVSIRIDFAKRGEIPKAGHHLELSVQPSVKVPNGVFMTMNDHHDVASDKSRTSAESAASTIQGCWQPGWDEANRVFDGVLQATFGREKND